MFEASHFYPQHITELLNALSTCDTADLILPVFYHKTFNDPTLSKIYSSLNYPAIHNLPCSLLKAMISDEYTSEFPPIDHDLDVKPGDHTLVFNELDFSFDLSREDLFENKSSQSEESPNAKEQSAKIEGRSRNGLKVLSYKVKEIIEKLGCSTYSEVADNLLKDQSEWSGKEVRSIRRRVYDALNVLIAVGVVKKFSKKVEAVKKAKESTHRKIRKLQCVTERYLLIKALIERNKCFKKGFQNLFLPFDLVVIQGKTKPPAKITTNLHRNNVTVRLNESFKIIHAEDLIKHLNVTFDFSCLPEELISLLLNFNIIKQL